MSEMRLFDTPPEYTTARWYASRERAPHLDQPAHRPRLELAASMVHEALARYGLLTVSDMGCGDGGLLSMLEVRCWGYDLQPSNVQGGVERGVDVRLGDATVSEVEWGDLTVCTEMLEHLIDPHGFLESIPSRVVVASSPWTETAEAHYGFHTWAWDLEGYATMFQEAGFGVVRHERTGMFQVLMGARA